MRNDQQDLELREPRLTKDHTQTQTRIGMVEITSICTLRDPRLRFSADVEALA